jgi:hypothetical protein
MKTLVDATLRLEAARFGLLYRCEDCAYFEQERGTCSHGYPTDPHRKSLDGEFIVFCKEFDAGP